MLRACGWTVQPQTLGFLKLRADVREQCRINSATESSGTVTYTASVRPCESVPSICGWTVQAVTLGFLCLLCVKVRCRPHADSCGITAVGALESMHAVYQNGNTTGRLDGDCFWVSDVLTNWELRTKTICSLSIDALCEDTFDATSSFHNCWLLAANAMPPCLKKLCDALRWSVQREIVEIDLYDLSVNRSAERIIHLLEERWHDICKKHSAVAQGQTVANMIERKDGVRPSSEEVLCKQLQLFLSHCQQLSWAHYCNVRRCYLR